VTSALCSSYDVVMRNGSFEVWDGARDAFRDLLTVIDRSSFARRGSVLASVSQIINALTKTGPVSREVMDVDRLTALASIHCATTWWTQRKPNDPRSAGHDGFTSVKEWLILYLEECLGWDHNHSTDAPSVLIFETSTNQGRHWIQPELELHIGEGEAPLDITATFRLSAIIYLGWGHYTCRVLDEDGNVFFYDGMSALRVVPQFETVIDGRDPDTLARLQQMDGRFNAIYVYAKICVTTAPSSSFASPPHEVSTVAFSFISNILIRGDSFDSVHPV
jgi:hypothetical protein